MPDDAPTSLGPCCICDTTGPAVRVLVLLNAKAPVRGHGWGCALCALPAHGALAVICEACAAVAECDATPRAAVEDALRFACRGYPGTDGRLPIDRLRGEHGHDRRQHPELAAHPPLQPLPSDTRFGEHGEEGQGCHCSRCGQTIWDGVVAIRCWPTEGSWALRYHPTCLGAVPMDDDPYSEDDGWDVEMSRSDEEDARCDSCGDPACVGVCAAAVRDAAAVDPPEEPAP